uniref:Uncharacterized protein n=1 Tax=Ditylenchus dipsaci TaxID=166011 RepID=A0A915D9B7_9BILA
MSSAIGPPKFSVTTRPECLKECRKIWCGDERYLELLNSKILPTFPEDFKITLSFTWPPSRHYLIDYASREFILTCANQLTIDSLPHVLHWFKHFRDHDAYIEQLCLLGFSLPLWDLTSSGYENETIRCKYFTLQNFDQENVFIQMLDFLTRHIRSQDTVIEFHPQHSSLDDRIVEEKLINFLFHGSKVTSGQVVVYDFVSDSFLKSFFEAFKILPNTNSVIPAIQLSFTTRELKVDSMFETNYKE